ncbi:hypothetical protein C8J57DRAFT_1247560 [Mycena rebaudengoi]|nr:hypothetical protein C8J57DRAFT_1247560 [Mycena rebaudengoi]
MFDERAAIISYRRSSMSASFSANCYLFQSTEVRNTPSATATPYAKAYSLTEVHYLKLPNLVTQMSRFLWRSQGALKWKYTSSLLGGWPTTLEIAFFGIPQKDSHRGFHTTLGRKTLKWPTIQSSIAYSTNAMHKNPLVSLLEDSYLRCLQVLYEVDVGPSAVPACNLKATGATSTAGMKASTSTSKTEISAVLLTMQPSKCHPSHIMRLQPEYHLMQFTPNSESYVLQPKYFCTSDQFAIRYRRARHHTINVRIFMGFESVTQNLNPFGPQIGAYQWAASQEAIQSR